MKSRRNTLFLPVWSFLVKWLILQNSKSIFDSHSTENPSKGFVYKNPDIFQGELRRKNMSRHDFAYFWEKISFRPLIPIRFRFSFEQSNQQYHPRFGTSNRNRSSIGLFTQLPWSPPSCLLFAVRGVLSIFIAAHYFRCRFVDF